MIHNLSQTFFRAHTTASTLNSEVSCFALLVLSVFPRLHLSSLRRSSPSKRRLNPPRLSQSASGTLPTHASSSFMPTISEGCPPSTPLLRKRSISTGSLQPAFSCHVPGFPKLRSGLKHIPK